MAKDRARGDAEQEPPSGMTQTEWIPWRWPAATWAAIAVVALIAALFGVIGVLGSGFVFDPDDHGTDFYASLAGSQLEVLSAEILVCVVAGLSCVLAVVRGSAQPGSAVPATIGAVGFVVAVVLLFLALQIGVPSLAQARIRATRPPI